MEHNSNWLKFCQFLQEDLAVSRDELNIVIQRRQHHSDPIPMLLWQYGLISINQLQKIFDWLSHQPHFDLS